LDNGNVIRPLILEESSNDAEALASSLRNAGYAVRYKHVEDDEDLLAAIEDQSWDMLLAAAQVGDYTAQQACHTIKNAGKDIPVIVMGPEKETQALVNALKAGASSYVLEDESELLLLIIERELANIRERRAHRLCKKQYAESEKRNRVLIDSSRDPIAYIHEGMHIYANDSYLELFGYENSDDLEGVPIMDLVASEDQQSFKDVLRRLSQNEIPEGTLEYQVLNGEGATFTATMQFSTASIDGEPCSQVIIHQKGDNKELEAELQKLRQQDLLTGLFNRQYFSEELKTLAAKTSESGETSALIYIEPDNFKSIKEALGVGGSDLVLADIGQLIKDAFPANAILARYTGTIFTALMENVSPQDIGSTTEKIRATLSEKIFEVEGKTVSTTFSAGIALISETASDAKKLFANAESACAIAKKASGNQTHLFSEEDELANLEADKKMLTLIQLALKNDRFQLHFQPIVSLHAEPGERYEVLLRMLDQEDNIVMPAEFFSSAEQAGLLTEIDRWVIKNTAKSLLGQRKIGKEIQFFIKLCADSIRDPSTLTWISKLLQAARLHGSSMVFELSERSAIENLTITKTLSNGLKQLNCHFAIDHVGSDAGAIDYLKQLSVSFVKIDGSIIQNINDEKNIAFIEQLTELGRSKGFQTIAEHVQDPACLAVLWQHGVNFIQGHYLQKPEGDLDYDFSAGS
jgi:diguanylate cyclase (GGDEF)-like protein/PAS domain S-box-containing protein